MPLLPDWGAIQDWSGNGLPDTYQFVVADGGTTNNEPIELARTALAGISGRNPRHGMLANRGVVLIDPFAGVAPMVPPVRPALPDLAGALVTAVTQQTRYDTRDLLLAAYPDVFSRFMLTAVRDTQVGNLALATAGLSAFIGFAAEPFRRHDYLLGRKNCQDFLRSQFVLPAQSPVFAGRLAGVKLQDFLVTDESGAKFLPIIPLVGSAGTPETTDPWPQNKLDPSRYRGAIETRFKRLLESEFTDGPLARVLAWLAANAAEGEVADIAVEAMQAALTAWKLA